MPPKRTQRATVETTSAASTQANSATSRTPAIPWDSDGDGVDTSISVLLDWLTTGTNFKRYRGNTSGTTKVTMIQEVLDEMAAVGITHRNVKGVQTKIAELQGSYGKACDILRKTGSGVTDEDIRNGTSNLRITKLAARTELILKACKYFDDLDPILSDRTSANPPVISASTDISVPNLLADLSADEAEEEPMEETPTNGAVTSEPNEGAGDDEEGVSAARGTKRKAPAKSSENLGLERVLAASNEYRSKCFDAREARDSWKKSAKKQELKMAKAEKTQNSAIEKRKVMVLEQEIKLQVRQVEMAEIRERIRFTQELKALGQSDSEIEKYLAAQFACGEGSGTGPTPGPSSAPIDVTDENEDDEDDEDEEDW
ncbi:hypothetical protein MJO28_008416 [Puccinia striiformis f. sp. tritici]|uniref:Uncharacterized protein n=1 Tax=Puccinia striiformis f. sp. tritici TaxID=168172 RepID=A0ACC0ECG3_9BASI|nr:hypothetical protein MJO28_008416 [Puccinia striiformis f. sp. tritici]